jgi:hypothetical protein
MTTRRDIIKTALGAAAAMALPGASAEAVAKMAAQMEAPVVPPRVGWLVGQEDRNNWERIYAATKDEATLEWATIHHGGEHCESCGRSFVTGEMMDGAPETDLDKAIEHDCDDCAGFPLRADRVKALDPYEGEPVPDKVKYKLGFWIPDCARCGWSPDNDCGGEASDYGHIVGEDFVCQDCMTYADWRIADPQYADELLADYLDSEYGPEVVN